MNIIKSAKISRFLLKSVRDFNEFHTPRLAVPGVGVFNRAACNTVGVFNVCVSDDADPVPRRQNNKICTGHEDFWSC